MAISQIENASLASGVPSTAKLPAGTVLQVVNASNNTNTASTTSTYVDTGLTVSITPTSATNKILVTVHIVGITKGSSDTYGAFRLLRNSTAILDPFEGIAGYTASTATSGPGGSGCTYLDSPSTTSATTYKVQMKSVNNTSAMYINNGALGGNSTITVMEIAA